MKKISIEKLGELIEEIATFDLEDGRVFGSSYLVMQDGKLIYKKHFGVMGEGRGAVDDSTIFRLASMTKPITTYATLICLEQGLIALDDSVQKYFPRLKHGSIKIRHLLSHCSGFCESDAMFSKMSEEDKRTTLNTINFFADKELAFEPATSQAYSPVVAWEYLVGIIEKVTGENFVDFVKRKILIPCGMADTGFEPTKEQWSRFIDVCGKDGEKRVETKVNENCVFTTWPCTHPLGGAGMFSTLNDYAKFAQTMLNDGVTESGKRIVGEEWAKQMRSPQMKIEETTDWGFGVRVIKKNHPYLAEGSFGWSGAYGSHFWVDPANKIVAVFMKNATVDGGAGNNSSRNFESAVKRSLI